MKFYRKILDNGITVLFEKRDIPVVSVGLAVRSGGINESVDEKGISHFIEHMIYKGTETRNSKKIAEEIEKKGGELNGFTDEEITAFWCKMPSKFLDTALTVLGDIVKNPLFDKNEMEKERQVIFEEIRMRKDNPIVYVSDKIQSCLYGEPLKSPLIGTYETMNSINRKKLIERFNEVYQPENMIMVIVGDADFEKIVSFAEKNFEKKKGKIPKFEVKLRNESKIEQREGIDQANLIFAYHVPLAKNKDSYAARILNALMAGGMSSKLFQEIREKRNLAYAVKGEANINKDFSYNLVYVGTVKENFEKVKSLILEEFDKVSKSLSEQEFEETKKQIIGNYQISKEDSQSQMANLLFYEVCGNAEEFYKFEKNIKEVKLEDVKKLAKKAKGKYSFFALIPK